MPLSDHIEPSHLSADMKLIADVCGLDVARRLMSELPGLRLYVPHPNRVESLVRGYIEECHAQSMPLKSIAKEVGLSVDYVRNVIRNTKVKESI